MIGLFDMDLESSSVLTFPNLELMKLFSFYKKQYQPISLINRFNNMSNYEHIFVRREESSSELSPTPCFPIETDWGGLYYTSYKYKSFADSIIENQRPSIGLYQTYMQEGLLSRPKKHIQRYNMLLQSSFIRLYNNQSIPFQQVIANEPVIIYDYNIFEQDYSIIYKELHDRKPSNILYRWPIFFNTIENLDMFLRNDMITKTRESLPNRFIINLNFSYSDFRKLLIEYDIALKKIWLGRLFLPILPSEYQHNEPIAASDALHYLDKVLNFIYYAFSRGYNIHPFYIYNKQNPFDTIFRVVCKCNEYINKLESAPPAQILIKKAKQEYAMAIQLHPDIESLLQTNLKAVRAGGNWYGKFRYQT